MEELREEEVHETHDASRGLETLLSGTAGAEYFTMSDDEAAPAGGIRLEQFHEAPVPQVVERKWPNIGEPPVSRCSCAAADRRTGPSIATLDASSGRARTSVPGDDRQ